MRTNTVSPGSAHGQPACTADDLAPDGCKGRSPRCQLLMSWSPYTAGWPEEHGTLLQHWQILSHCRACATTTYSSHAISGPCRVTREMGRASGDARFLRSQNPRNAPDAAEAAGHAQCWRCINIRPGRLSARPWWDSQRCGEFLITARRAAVLACRWVGTG